MGTYTTNLNLYKPAYNEDGEIWWSKINENFDLLDSPLGALSNIIGVVSGNLKIYESYTDGSNYERLGINTAAGSITFVAETAGTGTDNINLVLQPAGTGQILFSDGSATAPSLAFANATTKGLYSAATGQIVFTSGVAGTPILGIKATDSSTIFGFGVEGGGANFGLGIYSGTTLCATFEDYGLILGANYVTGTGVTNGLLVEGAVGIGKLVPTRKLTVMTDLDIYELFTDADNYERYALIASGNQLEIKAETLGTGADNLDIALTPAGTGNVKFGTYGAEVALVAGYITIKDAGGTPRKLAVIA